jgi:hypothetical protein
MIEAFVGPAKVISTIDRQTSKGNPVLEVWVEALDFQGEAMELPLTLFGQKAMDWTGRLNRGDIVAAKCGARVKRFETKNGEGSSVEFGSCFALEVFQASATVPPNAESDANDEVPF